MYDHTVLFAHDSGYVSLCILGYDGRHKKPGYDYGYGYGLLTDHPLKLVALNAPWCKIDYS
jgi:hypothetical protein